MCFALQVGLIILIFSEITSDNLESIFVASLFAGLISFLLSSIYIVKHTEQKEVKVLHFFLGVLAFFEIYILSVFAVYMQSEGKMLLYGLLVVFILALLAASICFVKKSQSRVAATTVIIISILFILVLIDLMGEAKLGYDIMGNPPSGM